MLNMGFDCIGLNSYGPISRGLVRGPTTVDPYSGLMITVMVFLSTCFLFSSVDVLWVFM